MYRVARYCIIWCNIAFYYKTENNDKCCKMLHQVTFNNRNENLMKWCFLNESLGNKECRLNR